MFVFSAKFVVKKRSCDSHYLPSVGVAGGSTGEVEDYPAGKDG